MKLSKTFLWGQDYWYRKTKKSMKVKCRSMSFMHGETNILNKIWTNEIPNPTRKIIYQDQKGFIPELQGWFNIWKPINIINHINTMKNKKHIVISIWERILKDSTNIHDKNQPQFRDTMNILQNRKGYIYIYHQSWVNVIMIGENKIIFCQIWNNTRKSIFTSFIEYSTGNFS